MNLMVCHTCGAVLDTDDPRWRYKAASEDWQHLLPPADLVAASKGDVSLAATVEDFLICGRAMFKRDIERDIQLADERADLVARAREIQAEIAHARFGRPR